MKKILSLFVIILPWKIKRYLLIKIWKYELHPSARIGLAYVFPKHLRMDQNSKIENFTIAINLDDIKMGINSSINRSNWITGFPTNTNSEHFKHQKNRVSKLTLGNHSSITKNHHLDCTSEIIIGKFTTIAGYNTQFLTHSVNIVDCIQDSNPIRIGDYCFVGTNSVILGGSELPSYSVLGAKSLLNKKYIQEYTLYAGVNAKAIKKIEESAKYFHRKNRIII